MWQTLNQLGYPCTPSLEAMWESDAFNGTTTPRVQDFPSYNDWRRANVRSLVQLSGVPTEAVEEIVSQLLEVDKIWTVKAIEPALEILTLLKHRGVGIGLCSNWDHPIEPYVQQAGLPPFDGLSVSPVVGARKPHILMFEDICNRLSISPPEALFVGDSWSTDVTGTLRAGMKPVWIRRGLPQSDIPHLILEFDALGEFSTWLYSELL